MLAHELTGLMFVLIVFAILLNALMPDKESPRE